MSATRIISKYSGSASKKGFNLMRKRKGKKESINLKIPLVILGIIIILGGFFYWLFFSSYFKTTSVIVKADNEILQLTISDKINSYIKGKMLYILPKNNYFLLGTSKIEKKLQDEFKEIEKISVSRSGRHTLKIDIKLKKPFASFCAIIGNVDDKIKECMFIDNTGTAYAKSPFIEGGKLIKIVDNRLDSISIGNKVLTNSEIKIITQISDLFQKDLTGLDIREIKFEGQFDIKVLTFENWWAYFDAKRDIAPQIQSLRRMLVEVIKDARYMISYVDLRVEGRAYYK